ncbi:LuxR C-terminal-related transcriptional regulator [Nostoc sp.]|uniref:LuxR C-terminal-related transcriptional regulator n=1 Tax=Nostoc sp. TaxID=1180 RepID=UPI002FF868DC
MNSPQFNEALEKLRKAPRKVEVLKLLLAGQTNDQIAQLRGRAKGTVRKQISELYKDFGIIAVAKAVRTVGGKRAFNSVLCDFIAVLSYLSVAIKANFQAIAF